MLRPVLACLLVASSLGPAAAEEPLANLLGKLAPASVPQGSVEVMSWIERDGDVPELVVTLVPRGYHPCAAVHGYELYYLNVMAGPKRTWKFHNEPRHAWLLS